MSDKVFEVKVHAMDGTGNTATATYNVIGSDDAVAREKAASLYQGAPDSGVAVEYCETRFICSVDG
jgi:hypothetical protein